MGTSWCEFEQPHHRADKQRSCTSADLDGILAIIPHFAVFSPNLLEMQSILSLPHGEEPEDVVKAAERFADLVKQRYPHHEGTTTIVRAGAMGSYTVSAGWSGWVPAYWTKEEQAQVIDVTGGGNAWMGGLCAGLLISNGDYRAGEPEPLDQADQLASIYASTAASFAIQQRGLPKLETTSSGDQWNGDDPWRRLRSLRTRVDELERA